MRSLFSTPVERIAADWWRSVDQAYKWAFVFAVCVSVLAFGFEMSNLTLHHDDVSGIFIQNADHRLGRFGLAWLHYYGQQAYFMPFLQMAQGILLISAYGIVVGRFWGARNATDLALISGILSVFPYMGQVFQYNTAMAAYPAAHLLAALAVVLSTRATVAHGVIASLLYVGAFSIYQSVLANAATIFVFWLLTKLLFREEGEPFLSRTTIRATVTAVASVIAGGLMYLAAVSVMGTDLDSYQSAEKAFRLGDGLDLTYAIGAILKGTRSFFFWPENYFPDYLKKLQLIFLVGAAVVCLWLPKGLGAKIAAVAILLLGSLAPRMLQLLHAEGAYHNLTLTGYAVVVAGSVMISNRSSPTLVRNASALLALVLIAGYVIQCNWISTVNHLNTLAHFTTMTQVLSRVRSVPDAGWDGKTIAVVGRYDMPSTHPFKPATGVATEFLEAQHMNKLARLMREEVAFVRADQTMPNVLEYAATHAPWPHPASVGVVNGVGVVIFSRSDLQGGLE